MPGGYAGKFLDIDLSKGKISETRFDDETLEAYFGGRGLATKILWDRIGKKWARVRRPRPREPPHSPHRPHDGHLPGRQDMRIGQEPPQ